MESFDARERIKAVLLTVAGLPSDEALCTIGVAYVMLAETVGLDREQVLELTAELMNTERPPQDGAPS